MGMEESQTAGKRGGEGGWGGEVLGGSLLQPPVESRGIAPGGGRGTKLPEAESFF